MSWLSKRVFWWAIGLGVAALALHLAIRMMGIWIWGG